MSSFDNTDEKNNIDVKQMEKFVYNYDSVKHPYHYNQGDIECIDAIKASLSNEAFDGFLKGNVIKYLWRYQDKENPIEDLKKARWYLNKLISIVELD